jgi:hypothetical protein
MIRRLTPRQNSFVKNLTKGNNIEDSAILSGYSPKTAGSIGSQLLKNTKIIKALDKHGLSEDSIAKGIHINVKAGMGIKATADTSLRGLELASRLHGLLDKEDTSTNLSQTNIYINELKQLNSDELNTRLQQVMNDIKQLEAR